MLGKLAASLAPPEPELQHAALRLGVRGWETRPLPAPDGSGLLAVELDLCSHEAVARHSDGRTERVPLASNRSVATVTRELLAAVGSLVGAVEIDLTPQETPWRTPLDQDEEHATYDAAAAARYFTAATRAALVLEALRAPYRGRSTPVNAWWGSFDLAVSLYSGTPADPPADDFITRNAMDAEEVAVGWWPGDHRFPKPAFYAYAHPSPAEFADATLMPAAAHWNATLGEYIFDWDDVRSATDPHETGLEFARSGSAARLHRLRLGRDAHRKRRRPPPAHGLTAGLVAARATSVRPRQSPKARNRRASTAKALQTGHLSRPVLTPPYPRRPARHSATT